VARKTKRGARSRAPLSRERILRAAIALADESGIESLSMRKLGQALGVEAMSLYRHVAHRDELLDGMVDVVFSEIYLPSKGADWKTAMRQRAISAREVLSRHPWASSLFESRKSLSPERLRYADAIIGSLREGGFPIATAYRAFLVLDSYIYGFTLHEVSSAVDAEEVPEATARLRPQVPADAYPNVIEIMDYVTGAKGERAPGLSSEFEFGLDLILDGLERLRAVKPTRR
jgi:AcrR family transcriptional regulator